MKNLLPRKKIIEKKESLYRNIIHEKYHLMFLLASTKSGKTFSLTQLLLNYYLVPYSNQKIFIICPTVTMCKTWQNFIKLVSNFNQVIVFETIDENTFPTIQKMRNKEQVSPYVDSCENIIIIDDMSEKTRGGLITGLTKKYRHWKSCMFICSQAYVDLKPAAKGQLDGICLWGGICEKYLESVHSDLLGPFRMNLDNFIEGYQEDTIKDHSFIFINLKNKTIRKGWLNLGCDIH